MTLCRAAACLVLACAFFTASAPGADARPLVIASVGDSVASGEGNPAGRGSSRHAWLSEQCHRSRVAGPALAVAGLRARRDVGVDFLAVACSGASIPHGLLGTHRGIEPGDRLAPQLEEVEAFARGRRIDALLMSVGANDIGFGRIVRLCAARLADRLRSCRRGAAGEAFRRGRAALPARLAALAARLGRMGMDPGRVFVSEYFDPTGGGDGRYCRRILGATVAAGDLRWARSEVLATLNAALRTAARRYGWRYVGGVAAQFRTHGYCAGERWIMRLHESVLLQGDVFGALHLNAAGQRCYGEALLNDLLVRLLAEPARRLRC